MTNSRKKSEELKNKQVSFRITETLRNEVQQKLEQDGISITDLLTACLLNYVGAIPDTEEIVEKIKK